MILVLNAIICDTGDAVLCVDRAKLHHNAALVQVPIGLESAHSGIVDIINDKALFFTGNLG